MRRVILCPQRFRYPQRYRYAKRFPCHLHLTLTSTKARRSAFSLIELVLALALSTIVIGAIGYATYFYMLTLTRQQADLERKQVARAVMMMLQNDLRGAIQYKPQDYSGLENLFATQALAAGAFEALDPEGNGESGNLTELETGSNTESMSPPSTGESGSSLEVPAVGRPTLIGNANALVIDVSRLPRIDEYNPLVAGAKELTQLPSDVKAVCYFQSDQPPERDDDLLGDAAQQGGLYRRQIDRAVATFAGDSGLVISPDAYCKLVAPEIVSIGFRYWDGENWQTEWDSSEAGGFPTAIEVTLQIDPYRVSDPELAGNLDEMDRYRTVIHLPVAEPSSEGVGE